MYDPDHPEISGSITPPSDNVSTTDRETLVDFLRRLNERLRGEIVADAEAVLPLRAPTDDRQRRPAGPDVIAEEGLTVEEPREAKSIADEARRLHDTWTPPTRARHMPGATGSGPISLIFGAAIGL